MTAALAAVRTDVTSVAWTWGTTAAERVRSFPCDRWLRDADDALFRAVDVDAPAAIVFRWVCQLRVAPYSYDWIDNFGRESPSPRTLTPGLDALAVGQRVMSFFEIVEFERDRHVTAVTRTTLFGEIAATYVVVPRGEGTCRLVVKLLVRHPSAPVGWMTRALLPWGDLVMMRKQLLTLKTLAEKAGGRARERASWPTGSGGIGGAQARSAEHRTGPQESLSGGRARERASWPTGSGGIGSAQARSAEHWSGPQRVRKE